MEIVLKVLKRLREPHVVSHVTADGGYLSLTHIAPARHAPPSVEELIGRQFGAYHVVSLLGAGGMASVYKAYQPAVNRHVAVKVLDRHLTADPLFRDRFRHEAKIVAQFQHPHILPVFDFGETDGYTYLAMPFVQGGTLAGLLTGQPLRLDLVARAIQQVGSALDYAHSKGIVHRDIKPSNVLLDERGNCVLADFGIARLEEGATRLTVTGTLLGTPEYMSPEQAAGEPVGNASDIYSLGIVLYELLTGRVPFKAETPVAVAIKHLTAPLPPPRRLNPELTPEIEAVVLKALARAPNDRFPSGEALSVAFTKAVHAAQTVQLQTAVPPVVTSRGLWRVGLLASGVLLVVGTLYVATAGRRPIPLDGPPGNPGTTSATVPPQKSGSQSEPNAQLRAAPETQPLGIRQSAPRVTAPLPDDRSGTAPTKPTASTNNEAVRSLPETGASDVRDTDASSVSAPPSIPRTAPATDQPRVGNPGPSAAATPVEGTAVAKLIDPQALYLQGTQSYYGLRGSPVNYVQAATLFREACDAGHSASCYLLGTMLIMGRGALQDHPQALRLYQKACDGGDLLGCLNLGSMYRLGDSVPQDYQRTLTLYQRVCDGGQIAGCTALGMLYERGSGVPQDASRAASLYQQACDAKELSACDSLAALYERGAGVQKQLDRALALYQQACTGGLQRACPSAARLSGSNR